MFWWALGCHGGPDSDTEPLPDTDTDVPLQDDDVGRTCRPEPQPLPVAPTPVRSLYFLPTSNGWISATYAMNLRNVGVRYTDGSTGTVDQAHAVTALYDHLAQRPTESSSARDLLWDAYPGVRVDGATTWLNAVTETSAEYVPGTGIVEIVQDVGDVRVTTRWLAPFQAGGERDLVAVLSAENRGTTPHTVDLFHLWNAHTGGEGSARGEAVSADGGAVLEEGSGTVLRYTPLGAATATAAPGGDGRNPYLRAQSGSYAGDLVSGDDVAVGFQWSLGTIAAGATATRGSVMSWGTDRAALSSRVTAFVADRDADAVLAAEEADWDTFHAAESPPASATESELAVYRQSTAVLRMAQVREETGHGQILASLPPGNWNIAWPRDGAYATVGLVRSGHQEEARDFLEFIFEGEAGDYADRLGVDDYLVSACRYTGDGREESDGATCPDGSDAGPNVELDDFGLFLWAFGEYAARWPDDPWVMERLPDAITGVADPLVALIDPNRELLVPDSSIWERHWETCFPNGRKHFTYSTIQAVAGLRAVGEISGDATYTDAADRLRRGLLREEDALGPVFSESEDCPALASAPEEICPGCGPYDGAVVDAVNHGVLRPESSLALGTVDALQRHLQMDNGSPGFLRNDDGTGTTNPYPWYDDQEWVVVDLRMAEAYAKIGRATGDSRWTDNGVALVGWVTANARANHDLMPELLSDGRYSGEDDVDHTRPGLDLGMEYQGAVPMCGFGPGAYILALEAVRD